ncbi:helix-turn-helix domain-containing protein [Microvirga aerilata]|uniref:Helix-turn-helix domain-containing protein n=2 Tax=Microvirga aerilata TaxID=670292 RepID=A0A937D3C4_9HYPH|nr:helix-turn-helix domain-containing protein [Microvirga aerilata]
MTEEEIERNAREDHDNPPASDAELARAAAARAVRRARERTGLSQAKFAERFQINLARLKDWEQGRFMPNTVALAYLKVIETDPKAVARAIDAA